MLGPIKVVGLDVSKQSYYSGILHSPATRSERTCMIFLRDRFSIRSGLGNRPAPAWQEKQRISKAVLCAGAKFSHFTRAEELIFWGLFQQK